MGEPRSGPKSPPTRPQQIKNIRKGDPIGSPFQIKTVCPTHDEHNEPQRGIFLLLEWGWNGSAGGDFGGQAGNSHLTTGTNPFHLTSLS